MTIISKMWRQLGEKFLFLLLFLLNFEIARQRKYKLLQVSCHCCGAMSCTTGMWQLLFENVQLKSLTYVIESYFILHQ